MRSEGAAAYVFDRFVLDLDRGALLADGADRALRPKSFTLLRHFWRTRGGSSIATKSCKPSGLAFSSPDDSIAQCVSDIRRALSDNQQNLLRTLPRRGYLFTAQVARGTEQPASGSPDATTENEQSITRPARAVDKPSIAILPFQNMSGIPEQEYFADGMVEEITTALARIPWLFVIARNSSFTYRGQAIDIKRVGQELGVAYVLEGSVRKAGGRVRITGQLIDAVTGAHLWADRFDGAIEEVFELQDKVASIVAGVIEPALQAAETVRSAARRTEDLTAYDLYLRAYAMTLSSTRQVAEALRLLEQAVARDPGYAPALAWAAICCFRLVADSRSQDAAADRQKGIDFARRALEAAGDDPNILANCALALAYFGEDIDAMIALVDQALGSVDTQRSHRTMAAKVMTAR